MPYFIGIDLGTSSMKLLLVDEKGAILNTVTEEYPLSFPQPGWSEQAPKDWIKALENGIPQLIKEADASKVLGIAAGGQMHGLVALDENDRVLRPAILWNDGRTAKEVEWLNQVIGAEKLSALTANIAFAGFTAPKLLWMKAHEPALFKRICRIMLPKDYLVYKLTGKHVTDYSDASGTLLLDVQGKCWSGEMLALCGLKKEQMPKLYESFEKVGTLLPKMARKLGLRESVAVSAGAGDNAAAAVGTGTVGEGRCNLSIGTSGTLFISSEHFSVDSSNALHSFAHADGGYCLMGCMLSAASCNRWFCEEILHTGEYEREQQAIDEQALGRKHVYFLPYLMGERSPINDTSARGSFIGLTMDSKRQDLVQAVLEGVAFALRDSLEAAQKCGLQVKRSTLCGGGSKSLLWRRILANVLGIPLDVVKTEQGPGYGAAMLSMVGCGIYPSVQAAAERLVKVVGTIEPDKELTALYQERYACFGKLYPALKQVFFEGL